ncbi:hypothetical protein E3U43_019075 [Larimichthys crocea]|uniref:Uncharacterized protein n=1 Tax=Larimichthys crocea TaxID=215358 RepID=A0ACD3QX16_LARCR|nr:hypothetical protein E3U43_019075 [Larimichthys crocea]
MSLVKQLASQFPGGSSQGANHTESLKAPLSPPAVKTKPKWQPGGGQQLQSPEFPPSSSRQQRRLPCPSSSSAATSPRLLSQGRLHLHLLCPPGNLGSPTRRSPSGSFSLGGKKPPPTPQRNSSIKFNSSASYEESRRNLLSKFAPQNSTPPSSPCPASSSTGSPSKDPATGPPAPPKPGKLNLSNLPLALQAKVSQAKQSGGDFPSPPPECAYFPPPPLASELFPPPPPPGGDAHSGGPPRVAVVNPQPQAPPPPPPVPLVSNFNMGEELAEKDSSTHTGTA